MLTLLRATILVLLAMLVMSSPFLSALESITIALS